MKAKGMPRMRMYDGEDRNKSKQHRKQQELKPVKEDRMQPPCLG